MKLNIVSLQNPSPSFLTMITDPTNIISLDANFFIPPDRTDVFPQGGSFKFDKFKEIWLEPLINTFPNLALHDAVYDELLASSKSFVDELLEQSPPKIILLSNADLQGIEVIFRNTIEEKIAKHTMYNPSIDNSADKGEVKTLSYIATKNLLYFCSHDARALRLIDKATELETSLDSINAIRTYEVIYYLSKKAVPSPNLRPLYKYLYYLTDADKRCNPSWGEFVSGMDGLYNSLI